MEYNSKEFEDKLYKVIKDFMSKPGMLELFKKTSWFPSNNK